MLAARHPNAPSPRFRISNMAEQAKVTSIDAIEAFRSNLILYLSKARPTLEEITSEVLRTRQWLRHDQRQFWENELKTRRKKLERAQAELFNAMMSKLTQASAAQQMAVRRAQDAVGDAEARLAMLKRWDRELENRSEPLVKQVDQLHNYLTSEMKGAVAHLAQVIKALEAYTDVSPTGSARTAAPSDEGVTAGEEPSGPPAKTGSQGEGGESA